jgi:hypothetical protein
MAIAASGVGDAIIRFVDEFGVARRALRKVPMSTQRQAWPTRTGGFTVYYPDEGVAPTASDLTFGIATLTAKTWVVLTLFSRDLDEDAAILLGELIALESALAIAQAEDTNTFRGDGTSTYAGVKGVFGSDNAAVVTMAEGKTSFEDVDHDELVRLKYAVPTWVRRMPDCGYYMRSEIAGIVERLKDSRGRPIETATVRSGPSGRERPGAHKSPSPLLGRRRKKTRPITTGCARPPAADPLHAWLQPNAPLGLAIRLVRRRKHHTPRPGQSGPVQDRVNPRSCTLQSSRGAVLSSENASSHILLRWATCSGMSFCRIPSTSRRYRSRTMHRKELPSFA